MIDVEKITDSSLTTIRSTRILPVFVIYALILLHSINISRTSNYGESRTN